MTYDADLGVSHPGRKVRPELPVRLVQRRLLRVELWGFDVLWARNRVARMGMPLYVGPRLGGLFEGVGDGRSDGVEAEAQAHKESQ